MLLDRKISCFILVNHKTKAAAVWQNQTIFINRIMLCRPMLEKRFTNLVLENGTFSQIVLRH